jgi:RNA polymerase sigma factor (sigma-70 family)
MSENKQTPDSELLLQIVGYNSDAFDQLYNRYSATIYSLIKEIVTNPKQAEKILINVFSVFLKRIDQYSTTNNNIFTWLTLLARNISIDTLKRMKFVEDIPIYSNDYEIEFIVPNLSQEISLINLDKRNELSEQIKSYKSQLSEVQNLVLSLIYFEGLNEDEIAKRLNVTASAVRQKTLAIMQALHSLYTGKTENTNNEKEIFNLIKLESLGCLTPQERMLFNQMRNNDPDFLWKEYGEYQNLTALLATPIPAVKPANELNAELKNVFTKILQGSDVDYPIVASEITVVKTVINPVPEPLSEKVVQSEVAEKVEIKIETKYESTVEVKAEVKTETKSEKDSGFHIKFRERDPKELSILKKLDTIETKSSPTIAPAIAKTESEIKFKSYQKNPIKKQTNFIDSNVTSSDLKKVINAVINEDQPVQQKVSYTETVKQDVEIENDDPSIIIEEPKQVVVKEEVVIKNRLIPNSSINLKEIFRKDEKSVNTPNTSTVNAKIDKVNEEKPIAPVIEKPEIKIKTNEPPKELRRSSFFVDKDSKNVSNNPALTNKPTNESLNKISEDKRDIYKTENTILKQEQTVSEKPAAPVEKSDVKTSTNLPPKEIAKSNVFVDKEVNPIQEKQPVPAIEKPEIKIKPIEPLEPPKEIKKTFTEALKEEPIVKAAPIVEKPEIKIKSNIPVKEVFKTDFTVTKSENVNGTKDAIPFEEKPAINLKTNEISIPNEENKLESKKVEETFERIKPAVDRSNLRIRETVFAENVKKIETIVKENSKPNVETKTKSEKTDPVSALTDSINIDEILSKIEDEKHEPAKLSEAESYEKEIVKLRKKLKRNILISAALIAVLAASSVFVYLNFMQAPVQVVSKNDNPEKLNLAGQTSLILNNEFKPSGETESTVEANGTEKKEMPVTQETVLDKKVVLPSLPEISTKEESTLFASNIKDDLKSNNIVPTQTAAAKTEIVVPPKEIKKVEEEPAFFVAVEEMPELIGGIKGLQNKIVYPEIAKRVGVEGKVIVQAIVDENGKVVSVSTVKGIGSGCDEVAMDAVRNSKFVPGKQRGKNVKVQVTIPIVFKK